MGALAGLGRSVKSPRAQTRLYADQFNPDSSNQIRLDRCTSGHCKERRRHGAQIIYQDSALNTVNNLGADQRKLDEAEKRSVWSSNCLQN
jgi:hypothetical protein